MMITKRGANKTTKQEKSVDEIEQEFDVLCGGIQPEFLSDCGGIEPLPLLPPNDEEECECTEQS